jgi:hypothetical protein
MFPQRVLPVQTRGMLAKAQACRRERVALLIAEGRVSRRLGCGFELSESVRQNALSGARRR